MFEENLSPAKLLAAALLREAREESVPPRPLLRPPHHGAKPVGFDELDKRSAALSNNRGVRGPMRDIFGSAPKRCFVAV
jgi:hypothetical protein